MNPAAREMLSPNIEEAMKALPMGESTTVRMTGGPQLFRISHLSFPDRGFQHPFFLIEPLTAEVRQAEKAAYERIIRMIAHEVNNSVAGIVNLIDSEPAAADRLKALSAFVTRFAEVVKIPKPQLQLCDLSEEVEACQPFLENLCAGKPVRLEFCLTDEASPVHLDTVLFQQVLINIVKNAVESIGNNQGHITVTTTPYQLVVADNGRGIPAEVAQHLFTPF
jgi:signal transduction histidine kinase